MSKTQTLNFRFGSKHIAYMRRCRECTINVAEGAVRAGKTVDNVFVFADELETTPDKIHLATGSTAANAKLNIGVCNGYGLEGIFRGRCKWGKFKDNECLFVKTPTGQKIVIFAGAAKADSYKKIRGNSYGMWIATEINLHHENTLQEAWNRQLAAERRKIFWDLNPDNPNAPIYTDYIDKFAAMQQAGTMLGGYNYEHFTIHDNATITPERMQEIISQFDPRTVWYRRGILGQRCVAEGLVYQQFADEPDKYLEDVPDGAETLKTWCRSIDFITIGVDYGGNRSLTTFVAVAFHNLFSSITVIADHHISGRKGDIDSDRVNREFIGFIQRLGRDYPGVPIKYAFADSEAQYLTNGLRRACRQSLSGIEVHDSAKREITQRIYCAITLLNTGRLKILRSCKLLIGGLSMATWDTTKAKDTRLDNFSTDIDILDAFEYAWERYMGKLLPEGVPHEHSNNH